MRASNNSWAKFLQSSYFPVRFTIAVKYISYAPSSIKRDTVNSVMCHKIESLRDSSSENRELELHLSANSGADRWWKKESSVSKVEEKPGATGDHEREN